MKTKKVFLSTLRCNRVFATVAAMKKEIMHRLIRAAVLFTAAAVFSGLFVFAKLDRQPAPKPAASSNAVAGVSVGGAFSLTDHTGKAVTEKDYAGYYQLVFFGFTYCPMICPTTLSNIAEAMGKLDEAQRARLKTLFVTVDPERDTVAQMAIYVAQFHPDIIGLTGSKEQTDAMVKAYRVYAQKTQENGVTDYSMNHSGYIYLMSPDGQLLEILSSETSAAALLTVLRTRLKS